MMVRAVLYCGLLEAAPLRANTTTPKTVGKWVERFRAQGVDGLKDRAAFIAEPTVAACAAVGALRRTALHGQADRCRGRRVAGDLSQPDRRRFGLNKLSALEPPEPPVRYEYEKPGGLIHLDIKKLGRFERTGHRITGKPTGNASSRGSGWEFVHVCIDDASRVAFVQVMPNQRKESASFLMAATAYFARLGLQMRDDGQRFVLPVEDLPRRLQTNEVWTSLHQTLHAEDKTGKAERFIKAALRYAQAYQNSDQRSAELHNGLHRYRASTTW